MVLTGCRRGPGAKTQSPVQCPVWCCDRGNAPFAVLLPVSEVSAGDEEAASLTGAGTLLYTQ